MPFLLLALPGLILLLLSPHVTDGPGKSGREKAGAPARPPVHRLRRRSRRLARYLAIGFVASLITIFLVLTQTGVTRSYVFPKIAALLPGEVTVGGVHLGLNGDIVIEDLSLRAPGVPGAPSEFFRTKRLRVSLDIFSLRSNQPRASSLTLVEPVARVSVDKRTNAINLASVVWPGGSGGGQVPKVYVRRGIIELGEHEGSTYDVLRRVSVDGELVPAKENDGSYALSAREIAPATSAASDNAGFIVDGRISPSAVELTLRRLSLADWGPETVPSLFRDAMRRLNIDGVVDRAKLDYDFKEGLSAILEVRGVGMNLPVSGDEAAASGRVSVIDEKHPAMRMREVTGTIELTKGKIEARATGKLEELPYTVRMQYMGTTAESPFVLELITEGFELQQHPKVLRFAPEVARHWAAEFSNPTGIFDTWVEVSRGPGQAGAPGKIAVRGHAKFRGVTAAFHKFPYQFNDMSGTFSFDDNAIEMRDIRGRSAQGATVHAFGTIAPPNQLADVKLDIRVQDAPIDRALLEAIGPARRQIIDDLVSRATYDDLLARGLISRAESIDEAPDPVELPEGAVTPTPPPFALGGKADVTVLISRPGGKDTLWLQEVEVSVPRVGLVPEKFRYPIIGDDVRLKITGSRAEVISGRFRGLHGGQAELNATVELPDMNDPAGRVKAVVDVRARDVPIDALLLQAVPGSAISGLTGEAKSVRQMIELLGLSGRLDCLAHIGNDAKGELGYKISIATKGVAASPVGAGGAITMRDLTGTIEVEPARVAVALKGGLFHRLAPAGDMDISVEAALGAAARDHSGVNASLDVRGLDVAAPVETLAAIFSLDASQGLTKVRETARPTGRVGVKLDMATPVDGAGGAWVGTLVADSADDLGLTLPEGRVTLSGSEGRVVLRSAEATTVHFENFRAAIADDVGPIGAVGFSGDVNVSGPTPLIGPDGLTVSATGLRIDSALTRKLLEARVGEQAGAVYRDFKPAGSMDAEFLLLPDEGGPKIARGWVGPRTLAFERGGTRVDFVEAAGRIDIASPGGTFTGLMLRAPLWSVRGEGAWSLSAAAMTGGADLSSRIEQFEATYDLSSQGVPPDLLAVLPADVSAVLRELEFDAAGELHVKQGTISIRPAAAADPAAATTGENAAAPAAGPNSSVSARGILGLGQARLNVGLPITDCSGLLHFQVDRASRSAPVSFALAGEFDVLRISGVRMSQGLVRVESGAEPGRVKVPLISATCHGGRLAGEAKIDPGVGAQRLFDARIQISGARFGPLLADLRQGAGKPEPAKKAEPDDPDARGSLDAEVTLSGVVGNSATRRGRGTGRVGGGRVLSMPLLMGLIRFSNFQLPFDERLELAKASFYIDGPVIGFDEVGLYSRSIEISGGGTMTWPETVLDMRFNSRSLARVPVISELIEGIRDNLITTRVRGTLDDPDISVATPGESRGGPEHRSPPESKPAPTQKGTTPARPPSPAPPGSR